MKLVLLALVSLFSFSSYAGISVVGRPSADCSTPGVQEMAYLSAEYLGEENGRAHYAFTVSEYGCVKGRSTPARTISPTTYSLYFVNQEYSRDVSVKHAPLTSYSVEAQMSFVPSTFFAQFPARHYTVSYYPAAGSNSYSWIVTFTADPKTGKILTQIK
ncbi:hypothetical protein AZI86_15120 [Bdellovibrio bacteriovorus]|uniref:Uncharacterized protein n=1 Tax=Bdellovibrio bacteriovorus TaxID=959 RepID=A0A150WK14_BDEBC|nr:hypothetical protein [Bdellovibrio bacteriovorus]KYG64127.1 hypothetical protein AZI86_15120 [Bdellovibrio bacteriovorus]